MDHVSNYRPPKDSEDIDDVTRRLREEGCAPKAPSGSGSDSEDEYLLPVKKPKKGKPLQAHSDSERTRFTMFCRA